MLFKSKSEKLNFWAYIIAAILAGIVLVYLNHETENSQNTSESLSIVPKSKKGNPQTFNTSLDPKRTSSQLKQEANPFASFTPQADFPSESSDKKTHRQENFAVQDLPEDLQQQLEEPPPDLPADLQAQLAEPVPELPEDVKQALNTPPQAVSEDEVNNPSSN